MLAGMKYKMNLLKNAPQLANFRLGQNGKSSSKIKNQYHVSVVAELEKIVQAFNPENYKPPEHAFNMHVEHVKNDLGQVTGLRTLCLEDKIFSSCSSDLCSTFKFYVEEMTHIIKNRNTSRFRANETCEAVDFHSQNPKVELNLETNMELVQEQVAESQNLVQTRSPWHAAIANQNPILRTLNLGLGPTEAVGRGLVWPNQLRSNQPESHSGTDQEHSSPISSPRFRSTTRQKSPKTPTAPPLRYKTEKFCQGEAPNVEIVSVDILI